VDTLIIAIADDHALVREGLAAVLQLFEGVSSVVETGSLAELEAALVSQPDIGMALLDLNMPGMAGVESLEALQEDYPAIAIAILSATETPAVARQYLAAGAVGYIPKSANNDVLLGALKLIMSGGIYVPPFALQPATEEENAASPTGQAANLTDRQFDVLSLMVEGLSNKGIARELDLSESTVKTHSSAILRAFGVDNRMKAIREAIRRGLVLTP